MCVSRVDPWALKFDRFFFPRILAKKKGNATLPHPRRDACAQDAGRVPASRRVSASRRVPAGRRVPASRLPSRLPSRRMPARLPSRRVPARLPGRRVPGSRLPSRRVSASRRVPGGATRMWRYGDTFPTCARATARCRTGAVRARTGVSFPTLRVILLA